MGGVGELDNKANSVQLQLQLPTGTELGNIDWFIKFSYLVKRWINITGCPQVQAYFLVHAFTWPLLTLTLPLLSSSFSLSVHCFSPTLEIPRKLILNGSPYFDPTQMNM